MYLLFYNILHISHRGEMYQTKLDKSKLFLNNPVNLYHTKLDQSQLALINYITCFRNVHERDVVFPWTTFASSRSKTVSIKSSRTENEFL